MSTNNVIAANETSTAARSLTGKFLRGLLPATIAGLLVTLACDPEKPDHNALEAAGTLSGSGEAISAVSPSPICEVSACPASGGSGGFEDAEAEQIAAITPPPAETATLLPFSAVPTKGKWLGEMTSNLLRFAADQGRYASEYRRAVDWAANTAAVRKLGDAIDVLPNCLPTGGAKGLGDVLCHTPAVEYLLKAMKATSNAMSEIAQQVHRLRKAGQNYTDEYFELILKYDMLQRYGDAAASALDKRLGSFCGRFQKTFYEGVMNKENLKNRFSEASLDQLRHAERIWGL